MRMSRHRALKRRRFFALVSSFRSMPYRTRYEQAGRYGVPMQAYGSIIPGSTLPACCRGWRAKLGRVARQRAGVRALARDTWQEHEPHTRHFGLSRSPSSLGSGATSGTAAAAFKRAAGDLNAAADLATLVRPPRIRTSSKLPSAYAGSTRGGQGQACSVAPARVHLSVSRWGASSAISSATAATDCRPRAIRG
jgi:hypothetical protein